MQVRFASYNIHKAVGLDRRRDPDRILTVLREIDADVIALQECDMRFGARTSVLPRARIDDSGYRAVALDTRPASLGWHGNGFLVRKGIEVVETAPIDLPTLEPRGAVRIDLSVRGQRVRAVGMHLDLSGLRRRRQAQAVLAALAELEPCPTVLLGDLNEWGFRGTVARIFAQEWAVLNCGESFPARRPLASLDRIIASPDWDCLDAHVHHSVLASQASDHLPITAKLELHKN